MNNPTHSEYMFSNVSTTHEADRLRLLNESHNPYTLSYFSAALPGKKKILEIGCGDGTLAAAMALKKDPEALLIAVDREIAQVNSAAQKLKSTQNACAMQADIPKDASRLVELGPFDLIYCRWVICHVPITEQVEVLRFLFSLLTPGGVFLMEDCNNSVVKFHTKDGSPNPQYADDATRYFQVVYDAISKRKNLNLKRTPDDWACLFREAASPLDTVEQLGDYQVSLDSYDTKHMVTLGKLSCLKEIKAMTAIDSAAVISAYEQCEQDPNIVGEFLQESIISLTRRS